MGYTNVLYTAALQFIEHSRGADPSVGANSSSSWQSPVWNGVRPSRGSATKDLLPAIIVSLTNFPRLL